MADNKKLMQTLLVGGAVMGGYLVYKHFSAQEETATTVPPALTAIDSLDAAMREDAGTSSASVVVTGPPPPKGGTNSAADLVSSPGGVSSAGAGMIAQLPPPVASSAAPRPVGVPTTGRYLPSSPGVGWCMWEPGAPKAENYWFVPCADTKQNVDPATLDRQSQIDAAFIKGLQYDASNPMFIAEAAMTQRVDPTKTSAVADAARVELLAKKKALVTDVAPTPAQKAMSALETRKATYAKQIATMEKELADMLAKAGTPYERSPREIESKKAQIVSYKSQLAALGDFDLSPSNPLVLIGAAAALWFWLK